MADTQPNKPAPPITRRRVLWLGSLIAVVAAAVAVWFVVRKPDVATEPPPIRVAYAPVVLNLPSFIAEDKALFKKHGVRVEYQPFTSANDMINALVAGQVDAVAGVSLVPVLNLEARHPGSIRLLLHSTMKSDAPYDSILVADSSKLRDIKDLPGTKIGLYPGTTSLNLMKAFFRKHGLPIEGTKFVPLPPSSHVSALQSGSIDALLAYEPTLTTARLTANGRILFGSIFADLQSPSPISCTLVSRKFDREHPDVVRRFAAALDDGIRTIRSDPVESRAALTTHLKLTPEVAKQVAIVADALSTETSPEMLAAFVAMLVEIGELPGPLDAASLLRPSP